nr:DUF2431 domain-containing protein [Candidatus Woesearchaeota archaeon]
MYEAREDSFLLMKHIKNYAKGEILDIGTGSGILAKEASKYGNVLAVDIDQDALDLVKKLGIRTKKSDLFSNVKESFDLIIFNPPYLPEDQEEDEDSKKITTGGKKGHELIERFFSQVRKHLNKNGKILIIFSSLTGDVFKIMEKYGFEFRILEKEKLFFEELYVCLCKKYI